MTLSIIAFLKYDRACLPLTCSWLDGNEGKLFSSSRNLNKGCLGKGKQFRCFPLGVPFNLAVSHLLMIKYTFCRERVQNFLRISFGNTGDKKT